MSKGLFIGSASFALGLGVGIAAGIFICKNKYEEKADKEIASVRKAYDDFFKSIPREEKPRSADENKTIKQQIPVGDKTSLRIDYSKLYGGESSNEKINNKASIDKSSIVGPEEKPNRFILISPGDYKESSYEAKELYYYKKDAVLADGNNNIVTNPSLVVGLEWMNNFGKYEECIDAVYVRDTVNKIDYEIVESEKNFEDVVSSADDN